VVVGVDLVLFPLFTVGDLAESCVRVQRIDDVQVPDLNLGLEGAHGNIVAAGAVGVVHVGAEPLEAQGQRWQEDLVVQKQVFFLLFVHVHLEVADVVLCLGRQDDAVCRLDQQVVFLGVAVGLS